MRLNKAQEKKEWDYRSSVPFPETVCLHNTYMGGVDVFGLRRKYVYSYSCK
jgi:hypothetical protein